ncbi:MAG: acyltransferase [Caulobacteraceae bacterium]|nr:acyltransferase [Caulobacteraceae bacterium]
MGVGGKAGYRPDIDGLRALAITPVVAFHAGVPGFGGGFVGVDVFFVISGFLITGLLLQEQETGGRIRLLDFYARRVRRLLPALALMVLVTLALGLVLLSPLEDQQRLARSALATAGFASNVFFWRERGGYFGPTADILPLLHTWTLAVEEQFYLLWPLGMMLAAAAAKRLRWRLRRVLAFVLVAGGVTSFGLMLLMAFAGPGAAFYLTPCRAWELGLGAALAIAPSRGGARLAGPLAVAGLAAVLMAVVLFSDSALLPVATGLPALGALALLAAGRLDPANAVSRLLSAAPLRAIGKVSYGWYLWHWPLMALARALDLGDRQLGRDVALAGAALVLAAFSYRFLETPIRAGRVWPFRSAGSSVRAGLVILAAMAACAGAMLAAAEHRAAHDPLAARIRNAETTDFGALQACHRSPELRQPIPPNAACSLGDTAAPASVLLWGDSVAQQLIHPLDAAGKDRRVRVIARTMAACRPRLAGTAVGDGDLIALAACRAHTLRVLASLPDLKRSEGLRGVILAARSLGPDATADLATIAEQLRRQGLRLVIVAETPAGGEVEPNCLAYPPLARCSVPLQLALKRRAPRMRAVATLSAQAPGGVRVFDPFERLCTAAGCPLIVDGVIAYRDRAHLSRDGALLLSEPLAGPLAWAAGGP